MIRADQFYYYKSTGGHEIDLVFEAENVVYAIEIKSTRRPAPRDLHNLTQFSDRLNRPVRRYLVYPGEEYRTIDNVQLFPLQLCSEENKKMVQIYNNRFESPSQPPIQISSPGGPIRILNIFCRSFSGNFSICSGRPAAPSGNFFQYGQNGDFHGPRYSRLAVVSFLNSMRLFIRPNLNLDKPNALAYH
jgi:hypothetical protein